MATKRTPEVPTWAFRLGTSRPLGPPSWPHEIDPKPTSDFAIIVALRSSLMLTAAWRATEGEL